MLLRLCSLGIMLFYTMVLTIQTSEADVSNERKAVPGKCGRAAEASLHKGRSYDRKAGKAEVICAEQFDKGRNGSYPVSHVIKSPPLRTVISIWACRTRI